MAVWSEERRWEYVKAHGYEVLDELPEGWRVNELSTEPKPYGHVWICTGSIFARNLFGSEYRKALMRRNA